MIPRSIYDTILEDALDSDPAAAHNFVYRLEFQCKDLSPSSHYELATERGAKQAFNMRVIHRLTSRIWPSPRLSVADAKAIIVELWLNREIKVFKYRKVKV